jgi:hypothetical protein
VLSGAAWRLSLIRWLWRSGLCVKSFDCEAEISALDISDAGDQVGRPVGVRAAGCTRICRCCVGACACGRVFMCACACVCWCAGVRVCMVG